MIQKADLRIGNMVNFTGNGEDNFIKVKELWDRELVTDYAGNELCLFYSEDDLQPIPITPEILEKCGFELDDNPMVSMYKLKVSFGLRRESTIKEFYSYINDDDTCTVFYSANNSTCSIGIKHLHQLQNLYYALTGTELTYKP